MKTNCAVLWRCKTMNNSTDIAQIAIENLMKCANNLKKANLLTFMHLHTHTYTQAPAWAGHIFSHSTPKIN